MSKHEISSISEFLLHAGTDYRVFDMGRTIREVPSQQFLEQENGQIKPPFTRAQHAWFGIVFWDKTRSEQQYIWFVKLPTDENGLIVSACRNHFLQIIVDALGAELENADKKNGQLPDNPYSFIPNQNQIADFNSKSRGVLSLGKSQYFEAAKAYINSPMVIDWQSIALQGLTDLVADIDAAEIHNSICRHFSHFPEQVQCQLLISMENYPLPDTCMHTILSWMNQHSEDEVKWQHGLRSLSQTADSDKVLALLTQTLESNLSKRHNILVIISGRLWHYLSTPELLLKFFEKVAEADPNFDLFLGIFQDLVQLPDLREQVLAMLRNPSKSDTLSAAVGRLFSAHKS
ncbi:DUF3549 family protein [Aliiglaciecola sp. 3_MG-2023]|uniref:DUF3549 family protein n=1 Tax=Aliiglaciecola sp. 3_MG-2023 TaxID=3062644 RepID=UPI0026E1C76E|nr:DUF3549 family protein [Aliiglaciecola sp. 3_MG-2023]MDO6695640.1 DUF3549 family protein [Aliiglaciecola sp. 3_MG-2023]